MFCFFLFNSSPLFHFFPLSKPTIFQSIPTDFHSNHFSYGQLIVAHTRTHAHTLSARAFCPPPLLSSFLLLLPSPLFLHSLPLLILFSSSPAIFFHPISFLNRPPKTARLLALSASTPNASSPRPDLAPRHFFPRKHNYAEPLSRPLPILSSAKMLHLFFFPPPRTFTSRPQSLIRLVSRSIGYETCVNRRLLPFLELSGCNAAFEVRKATRIAQPFLSTFIPSLKPYIQDSILHHYIRLAS